MDRKTVFAALFLLFVLYIVGVGLGTGDGAGADIDQPGWTEALSRLTDRTLTPEDVSAATPSGCLQGLKEGLFVLAAGGTCTLTVEESASRFRTRSLKLTLTQGSGVIVVLDPREEDLTSSRATLAPGEELIVRFMRGGGTVSITCAGAPGGSPCSVQVVE